MLNSVLWTIMALVMTAIGLTLLYTSWRNHWRRGHHRVAVLGGWLLLAVIAMSCWVRATGLEFGLPLGLMAPTCMALLLLTCEWRRSGAARVGDRNLPRKDLHAPPATAPIRARTAPSAGAVDDGALLRWLGHFGRFILVVPLSALSAVLICAALSLILPFGSINNMLAVVFAVPVLWSVIAYWMLTDPRRLRPIVVTVATALVSSTVLFI
jgi:hypothetical protein